ncbi:MAG: hypothetical protein K2L56_08350 [Prevotella sp.]|nr:hypothetical protein [Prevotella sp.]
MKQTIYFFFWLFEVCSGVTLGSVAPFLVEPVSMALPLGCICRHTVIHGSFIQPEWRASYAISVTWLT